MFQRHKYRLLRIDLQRAILSRCCQVVSMKSLNERA